MNRKKIIFLIICVCFICFILIVLPIMLYYMFITPSKFGFIKPDDTGAWLGYYGAILSGAITLSGVLVTIKYHEKENDKNKSIEYKPILELTDLNFPEKIVPFRTVSLGIPTYGTPDYINKKIEKEIQNLRITNNGRGETLDARVDFEVNKENLNWTDPHNLYSMSSQQYIGDILTSQSVGIRIELPPFLLVNEEVFKRNQSVEINTILTLEYKDMFGRMKYQYVIHICFRAHLIKDGYEKIESTDLVAVGVEHELVQIIPVRKSLS